MRISDWSSDVCSSDLRIDARRVGQLCKLLGEGVIELVRMAAVVAVAGTGIEQGVATEEARRVAARQQADVDPGVARRVEHLELPAAADRHPVAGAQAAVHPRKAALGVAMCPTPCSRHPPPGLFSPHLPPLP